MGIDMHDAKYQRLIQDLRADLRPQRQWVEGRGIFAVIGHYLVGLAAGAWLLALFLDSLAGLGVAFLLACVGGGAHMLNLGKAHRFWRMMTRFQTSWVARGFWGLSLFFAGSSLYLAPQLFPHAIPGSGVITTIGYWLSIVGTMLLITYMGFVYTASKSIPFWNSGLHPMLYAALALRGGIAVLMVVIALGEQASVEPLRLIQFWLAATAAVSILLLLELHAALTDVNRAVRQSVRDLLGGRLSIPFYGGALLLGLVIPTCFAGLGSSTVISSDLLLASIGGTSALGDFFLKYCFIGAGVHLPVTSGGGRR